MYTELVSTVKGMSNTWWVDADVVKLPASLELDTSPILIDNVSDEVDAIVGKL